MKHSFLEKKMWVGSHNCDTSDRDELIAILRERFGTKTVVPISNYNQLQLKSLVKDISKLHDVPFDQVNQMTKKLDDDVRPHMVTGDETKGAINLTYEACLEYSDEFKKFMEQYPAVALDVQALYQQPKAVGRHAGGIILLDDPDSEMPLISVRGEMQTPWTEGMNSKSLSCLGLVKFDMLGLKTLRMFIRTIKLILQRHEGIKNPTNKEINDWYYTHITPSKIDPADQKVLKNVFHDGRFPGVFQFSQSSAQQFVQDIKPKNVMDIAIATAIYRPGPLAANVDKLYIKALNENSSKDYGHPIVNEVLAPSRGFVVFQEQISKVAMELSGFTAVEGEKLRKAILKRTTKGASSAKTETEILQEKFIEGAVANGYAKEKAEELYDDMKAFAAYGFVKSHAISYSYISYQCAWLFTYYPSEWLCAYAETMIGTPESRSQMMSELKSLGYTIADVDINNSEHEWTISDDGKTFYPSFSTVKGVGKIAVNEIIANRPYIEPTDLFWDENRDWKHRKFNKKAMSALIRTESFGSMGIVGPDKTFKNYAHMHHVIVDNSDRLRSKTKRDPERNLRALQELITTDIPEWTIDERIQNKKDLIGYFDVNMLLNPELLEKLSKHNLIDIGQFTKNGIYWFVISGVTEKTTKTGKSYLILSLLDAVGNTHKLTCWNASKDQVMLNKVCIAKVMKDNWGFKTKIEDIRVIE